MGTLCEFKLGSLAVGAWYRGVKYQKTKPLWRLLCVEEALQAWGLPETAFISPGSPLDALSKQLVRASYK